MHCRSFFRLLIVFLMSCSVFWGCTYSSSTEMLPETQIESDRAYIYGNFKNCNPGYLPGFKKAYDIGVALELENIQTGKTIKIVFSMEGQFSEKGWGDMGNHAICIRAQRKLIGKELGSPSYPRMSEYSQEDWEKKLKIYRDWWAENIARVHSFEKKNTNIATFKVFPIKPGTYKLKEIIFLKNGKEYARKKPEVFKYIKPFVLMPGRASYIGDWRAGSRVTEKIGVSLDWNWEFHGVYDDYARATHLLKYKYPQFKNIETISGL